MSIMAGNEKLTSAEAYLNRGNAYYSKSDIDGAIEDYTEAIRLNPKYADAYFNRGNVYKSENNFEKAIADYSEAIRLDPKFADAYCNRGTIYGMKGDFDKASADFKAILQLSPNNDNAAAITNAKKNLELIRQKRGW